MRRGVEVFASVAIAGSLLFSGETPKASAALPIPECDPSPQVITNEFTATRCGPNLIKIFEKVLPTDQEKRDLEISNELSLRGCIFLGLVLGSKRNDTFYIGVKNDCLQPQIIV